MSYFVFLCNSLYYKEKQGIAMLREKFHNLKRVRFCSRDIFGYLKNYCSSNKLFLLTYYLLYLTIFAISLFIVLNYDNNITHDNYYQLLMQGEYEYVKVSLKYSLYNLLIALAAMLTYRKKYTFACLYFLVTFIAYRLAVNIVGGWQYSLIVNLLNTLLFYFPIFTVYVTVIVTAVCYINSNYLYCNDHCPITLKKMLLFTLAQVLITTAIILIHTLLYPYITAKILF